MCLRVHLMASLSFRGLVLIRLYVLINLPRFPGTLIYYVFMLEHIFACHLSPEEPSLEIIEPIFCWVTGSIMPCCCWWGYAPVVNWAIPLAWSTGYSWLLKLACKNTDYNKCPLSVDFPIHKNSGEATQKSGGFDYRISFTEYPVKRST